MFPFPRVVDLFIDESFNELPKIHKSLDDKFIDFFAEYYTKKVDKKQIIKGLSFLDKNKNGYIKAKDLNHALSVIGEKLTEKECNDFLNIYTDKNGMINYKQFTEDIFK